MRAWKIIVVCAPLSAALIVIIAHHGSNGLERGRTTSDLASNPRQQIQKAVVDPVAPRERAASGEAPDTEPWGPFRTVDW